MGDVSAQQTRPSYSVVAKQKTNSSVLLVRSVGESTSDADKILEDIKCSVNPDDVVLVKGLEKKKWLERFISNRLIDLHDEWCPNWEKLKTIFKS
nr:unnamed protein product [Callosobruchus analis]